MPGLDGRGPRGMGSGTGRRRGYCNFLDGYSYGRRLGMNKWDGVLNGGSVLNEREALEQRKEMLKRELDAVEGRLNNKDTGKSK